MCNNKNLRAAVALSLLAVASAANADIVSLRDQGSNLTVPSPIFINGGDFSGSVTGYIGSYTIGLQTSATSFVAYCVDPFQHSNSNYQSYSLSTLVAANLPEVEAVRFGEVTKLYANAYAGSLANATKSAGFQIALWEVWHDDKNLADGKIRKADDSNSAIFTEAQTLLTDLAGWTASTVPALTLYSNGTYQDYVVPAGQPGSVFPIPEPGTYALLLAGFGVLGLARRRQA